MLKQKSILLNVVVWATLLIFETSCENPIKEYYDKIYSEAIYEGSGYSLNAPDTLYTLPPSLNEVSGLTLIDDSHLAAVQDERGEMFIFDLNSGTITQKITFARNGDYEGIELVASTIFIIKSNGLIHRFEFDLSKDKVVSEEIETALTTRNDVEGLGYDKINNRLLIACKGKGEVGENEAKGKSIYAFDLDSLRFDINPVLSFRKKEIGEIIANKYPDMKLGKEIGPSGIAVHPISGKIYILAHEGKALLILNEKNQIEKLYPLNPSLFQQPEGICFNTNGDMFISNELVSQRPNLLKFIYHK